jgi:hypothetical protein
MRTSQILSVVNNDFFFHILCDPSWAEVSRFQSLSVAAAHMDHFDDVVINSVAASVDVVNGIDHVVNGIHDFVMKATSKRLEFRSRSDTDTVIALITE